MSHRKLNIAFFGLPLGALALLRDGHTIVFAGISRPEAPGLHRLRRSDVPVVLRPTLDGDLVERLVGLDVDLIVSWFWTSLLPTAVLQCARLGGINAHPSLLPRHRGPDPTFWTIDLGDTESGVTIHRLAEAYDTGDVLAQVRIVVDPSWSAWQLARRLDGPSLCLMRSVVDRARSDRRLVGVPQSDEGATYAPFPTDADAELCWKWPTARILRRIRALAPAPGAFTQIGDATVTVEEARPFPDPPRALEPGEGAAIGGKAVIRTLDGAIELLKGEISGERSDAAGLAAWLAQAAFAKSPTSC